MKPWFFMESLKVIIKYNVEKASSLYFVFTLPSFYWDWFHMRYWYHHVHPNSSYMISLLDLGSLSKQKPMGVQSSFTLEQCQFSRLMFSGCLLDDTLTFSCFFTLFIMVDVTLSFSRRMAIHLFMTVRRHLKKQWM